MKTEAEVKAKATEVQPHLTKFFETQMAGFMGRGEASGNKETKNGR